MSSGISLIQGVAVTSPFVVLCVGAVALMVLSTFFKGRFPAAGFTTLVLIGALFALYKVVDVGSELPGAAFGGMVILDHLSGFMTGLILCAALLAVTLGAGSLAKQGIESTAEYYVLFLIAVAGAILFCCAGEMVTLFLALETMSMALYCLCGSALSRRESSESALKYFLLGSFSSAVMLYGIALLYGLTGSLSFEGIAHGLALADSRFLIEVAIGLTLVGLIFKIGSVPFHFWAPDVYQGAPTAVTIFMATVIKAASIGALLRVLTLVFDERAQSWEPVLWYASLLSMVLGNFLALRQHSVKRMLAYSSVANAGYLLLGALGHSDMAGGQAAILYYLVGYAVMTIGAMGVVMIVSQNNAELSDDVRNFNGLAKSNPVLAAFMALFLLALAGLPPGMVGLIGKIYLFSSAVRAEFVGLAIVGILASVIGCYYYLNIIVAMYFRSDAAKGHGGDTEQSSASQPFLIGVGPGAVLTFCAIAVVLLGTFPSLIYDLGANTNVPQMASQITLIPIE